MFPLRERFFLDTTIGTNKLFFIDPMRGLPSIDFRINPTLSLRFCQLLPRADTRTAESYWQVWFLVFRKEGRNLLDDTSATCPDTVKQKPNIVRRKFPLDPSDVDRRSHPTMRRSDVPRVNWIYRPIIELYLTPFSTLHSCSTNPTRSCNHRPKIKPT